MRAIAKKSDSHEDECIMLCKHQMHSFSWGPLFLAVALTVAAMARHSSARWMELSICSMN